MKNYFTLILFISFAVYGFSQPVSKKGEPYLPAEGDWAIAIDAAPFLEYFGNFFSDNENKAPHAKFANNNFHLKLKKFKTPELAYRASLRFNIYNHTIKDFSPEYSTEPTNTMVEDKYSQMFTNFYAAVGIEKRKGNTRVQGFYGIEGGFGFGTEKHKFDYGNKITNENTNPVRSEFNIEGQQGNLGSNFTEVGGFITEYKMGTTFTIGAQAFVGAEVFIFPKWSVGFEFAVGVGFQYTGNGNSISEQWTIPVGGNAEQFVTTVTDSGGSTTFSVDNHNTGGAIFMTFYF